MAEALLRQTGDTIDYTPTADVSGGQVLQILDGRAAVAATDIASGVKGAVQVRGVARLAKTASIVLLKGGRVYWDHSANAAHFKPANDRDFFVGIVATDAASSDTTVDVVLNVPQALLIDVNQHAFRTAVVKTVVGSTTVEVPDVKSRGGSHSLILGTTAEAQKVDLLSVRGFAPGANVIVEGIVTVLTNSDNAAGDFNIGIANATHATDADAITESCFIHTDGNSLNINAESDDGTTEVAATDTTLDFAVGTPFEFWIDARDPSDIQMYIDGVLVLGSTVFKLNAATGPLKLLAHLEKSSDDSPGEYAIDRFTARIAED